MRFGKKLAIQVTDDTSGAPYLSHKVMKEVINKTVRELRTYQGRQQGFTLDGDGGLASPEELAEYEQRIGQFDEQLFTVVEEDLVKIMEHIHVMEFKLQDLTTGLQEQAIRLGVLIDEEKMDRLEKVLPFVSLTRAELCQELLELRVQSNPHEAARVASEMTDAFNVAVAEVNSFTQYLEINVAGFRKLLKRHEKQIPRCFHARQTPFLAFHKIVTRASRQLLDSCRGVGKAITDLRARLGTAVVLEELTELKGLGAECLMVLEIQKQLRDVGGNDALLDGDFLAKPGMIPGSADDDD